MGNEPSSATKNHPPTSRCFAWSTRKNNRIKVVDLDTKQEYMSFDGAKIRIPCILNSSN